MHPYIAYIHTYTSSMQYRSVEEGFECTDKGEFTRSNCTCKLSKEECCQRRYGECLIEAGWASEGLVVSIYVYMYINKYYIYIYIYIYICIHMYDAIRQRKRVAKSAMNVLA